MRISMLLLLVLVTGFALIFGNYAYIRYQFRHQYRVPAPVEEVP